MASPLVAVVDDVSVEGFVMEVNINDSLKLRWVTGAQGADPTQEVVLILLYFIVLCRVDTVEEIMLNDVRLLTHGALRNLILWQIFLNGLI